MPNHRGIITAIIVLLTVSSVRAAAPSQPAGDMPRNTAAPAHDHREEAARPRQWTSGPLIVQAGRPTDRGIAQLAAINLGAIAIDAFSPHSPVVSWTTPIEAGIARISPSDPSRGGMHWLMAREESESRVTVANTMWTFSSKGPSPELLLQTPKSELEIVPQPAVTRYREGEKRGFVVRFKGQPWSNAPIYLETENGSRTDVVADAAGHFSITIPRDFETSNIDDTDRINRLQAQMLVWSQRSDDGRIYLTGFNALYSPDRIRGKSLAWGGAFMLLGMVLALPLLRRKETSND